MESLWKHSNICWMRLSKPRATPPFREGGAEKAREVHEQVRMEDAKRWRNPADSAGRQMCY